MNTEEQIANLLKQRYKVIADFPNNQIPVGTIITRSNELAFDKYPVWHYSPYDKTLGTWNNDFENYPHLYKPLPWYAERKLEELYLFFPVIKKIH